MKCVRLGFFFFCEIHQPNPVIMPSPLDIRYSRVIQVKIFTYRCMARRPKSRLRSPNAGFRFFLSV